jgi:hypothetical protein
LIVLGSSSNSLDKPGNSFCICYWTLLRTPVFFLSSKDNLLLLVPWVQKSDSFVKNWGSEPVIIKMSGSEFLY